MYKPKLSEIKKSKKGIQPIVPVKKMGIPKKNKKLVLLKGIINEKK